MTQIDALTPAQQARLAEMAAEGGKVGACMASADRPRAEAAIAGLYRLAGCPAPRFLWAESPLTAQLSINLLMRKGTQLAPCRPDGPRGGAPIPWGRRCGTSCNPLCFPPCDPIPAYRCGKT